MLCEFTITKGNQKGDWTYNNYWVDKMESHLVEPSLDFLFHSLKIGSYNKIWKCIKNKREGVL